MSSRMGEDKANLQFQGESLIQRSLKLLEASGSELILVSGREGYTHSVADSVPNAGPPGALYACLDYLDQQQKLDNSPLLIIPVDMPLLNPKVLINLVDSLEEEAGCQYENEIFPCVMRASTDLKAYLQALFKDGQEPGGKCSMRSILTFCQSRQIAKEGLAEQVFSNINTPEDLVLAQSEFLNHTA